MRFAPSGCILRAMDGERRMILHLVFNPAADRGRADARRKGIGAYLMGRGVEVMWHETGGSGHAESIVRELPDGEVVVAAGGDGTVHEVAAGCAGTRKVMGVLPLGSGNDYVKALGIGTRLGPALEVLAGGRVRTVDAGEVNGTPFNNGLGIGFDAEVAAGVAEAPKALGGFGGYLWSVGRLLWGMKCHEATMSLDGGEAFKIKTILVAAALGTTYGARFKLAPGSSLTDGAFDIVWSEEVNRVEVLRLVPAVLRGTHLSHPKVYLARAREVEVSLAEPVPAHVDGEMLPPTLKFHARVLPDALRVLVP